MRIAEGRNGARNIMSLKVAKRRSIAPHSTEKAGKKFLTSYPFFVAIRYSSYPVSVGC